MKNFKSSRHRRNATKMSWQQKQNCESLWAHAIFISSMFTIRMLTGRQKRRLAAYSIHRGSLSCSMLTIFPQIGPTLASTSITYGATEKATMKAFATYEH